MSVTNTSIVAPAEAVVWECDGCGKEVMQEHDSERNIYPAVAPEGWLFAGEHSKRPDVVPDRKDFCSSACLEHWVVVGD